MGQNRLSIRALVVLAAELGAAHLFGVRDPFMMLDHEEIRAAYESCLEELEQVGAITRQFEGVAVVCADFEGVRGAERTGGAGGLEPHERHATALPEKYGGRSCGAAKNRDA